MTPEGAGDLLAGFLEVFEDAQGVLSDLPHVRKAAEETMRKHGIDGKRFRFVEADFFRDVPEKADLYLLSRILHDWEDEKADRILQNIVRVMDEESLLLVIEKLIPEEACHGMTAYYMQDLYMWAVCGGKERSTEEFEELFRRNGLRMVGIRPISEEEYVLELKKDTDTEGEL